MAVVKKRKWLAYVLWLFGGFFGLHQFYLERDLHAFALWCTFGGLGLGWLRDLWNIPHYVADVNQDENHLKKLIEKMQKHQKPPFSIAQFFGQMGVSYVLSIIYFWSIPNEEIFGWDITFLRFLTPIPISIGAWIVGNIGQQQGRLKPVLVSASISYALSYSSMPGNLIWCAFSAAIGFNTKSKEWRRTPIVQRGWLRRIAILSSWGLIFIALICSGLYFNAEVVDKDGENVKFRDSVENFINSPMWENIKEQLIAAYNYYRAYGWSKLWENLVEALDPHGEKRALKTLGLPETASKPEIIAKFRALSKEWHPDRHKDEAKKQEAHDKFLEYQSAYQKLIKIRGKIKAATSADSSN